MNNPCPTCGGKGLITIDCPYCRDCDPFEHSDLTGKTCLACSGEGFLEQVCPFCSDARTA